MKRAARIGKGSRYRKRQRRLRKKLLQKRELNWTIEVLRRYSRSPARVFVNGVELTSGDFLDIDTAKKTIDRLIVTKPTSVADVITLKPIE